jgi:serine/threonine protein kinase/tetratricopeptide (TPR) repeat protein
MSRSSPPTFDPAPGAGSPEPASSILEARSRKRALLEELHQSWAIGAPLRPEDLLARWPTNPSADPDVASLLFEDWQQKRQRGQEPNGTDYEQRFPAQRDSLKSLLHEHQLIHSLGGSCPSGFSLALPSVGDELFGFRLRHELGRGAFARVFLGEQVQLAGRPVVLKISKTESAEPQTMAQLQHTNIVPIYSLHEDAKAGVRLVCMPYFGGASLSQVLRAVHRETKQPRQGAELARALQAVQAPSLAELNAPPPPTAQSVPPQVPLGQWQRLTCLEVAAWIVARLADALQHAHQRGVLHRDIKPSNILLAADGEPLLLDFNLSDSAQNPAQAALGGTVAYMAPEHLRAMASRNPVLVRKVDQRADIYSLGMVLFETLVGARPFEQSASYSPMPALIEAMAVERSRTTPSLRRLRPDVPWSLESIVRKCLAPDPDQRYQHAEQVADDLRAFLTDQPLRHAPELSRVEQARKWLRRHPRLASSGSVAAVAAALLLTAAIALFGMHQHLQATQEDLSDAGARQRQQSYDAGAIRALCLVNTTSDWASHDHLRRGIQECEETLGMYDVLTHADWQERDIWRRLPNDNRAETTRELLLLLARGRVQLEPENRAVLQGALALLDKAEAIDGLRPTRALLEDRADYLERLGRRAEAALARAQAKELAPNSARDHYLLAAALIRHAGAQNNQALAALDRAVQLQPKHYWSFMQRGAVHFERGDWTSAARDFGVCKGLWPQYPLAYFNLGCVQLRLGRPAEAIVEFTQAAEREPDFLLAYLNRGLACLEMKRYQAALADFTQVKELGRDDAVVRVGQGVALEGLGRHAEAEAAFAQAWALADATDPAVQTRLRWVYGFAVAGRLPDAARQAFDEVLDDHPEHPQALYGLGMLAAKQDQLNIALSYFQRAIAGEPNFREARRFRAVLLARRGYFVEAAIDINWCLDREPKSGADYYAAACVASLALDQRDAAAAQDTIDQAAKFLRVALDLGYGRDQARTDPDLAGLRRHPVFQQILNAPQP